MREKKMERIEQWYREFFSTNASITHKSEYMNKVLISELIKEDSLIESVVKTCEKVE